LCFLERGKDTWAKVRPVSKVWLELRTGRGTVAGEGNRRKRMGGGSGKMGREHKEGNSYVTTN